MRNIIYILFILIGYNASAQEWRDSLKVARDAYKKQEYSKALKYYQSAQNKAPEEVDLSDEMGQSAYKAREFEKAEKIYQQSANAKKSKNDKAKTYHNMGNSRMQKKDYNGAIDSYKEAIRNNPKDEETRYNLSEAIRRLKDQQKKREKENKNNPNPPNPPNPQNQPEKSKSGNDPKDKQSNPQNNSGEPKEGDSKNGENPSRLPNKSVERMLDKLMKAEAETKRKMGGSSQEGSSTKSGKDW